MLKSIFNATMYPKELRALLKLKYWSSGLRNPYGGYTLEEIGDLPSRDFCYAILHKVSRSFAAVIQQLPEQSRDAICAFYLVLRGLDTIEDDMSLSEDLKRKMLNEFYQYNFDPDWNFTDLQFEHDGYRLLLSKYQHVSAMFRQLSQEDQDVITDICKRMGKGMSEFGDRPINTVEEYDLYCHYVAGLVGIGLSGIFAQSGLEDPAIDDKKELANAMGLFLQKTNITRDINEDVLEGRIFWPKEIWSKHVEGTDFLIKEPFENGLQALNAMVINALSHLPDCIEYLACIRNSQVFRFCAIPQAMAIATLHEIYNNPEALKRNVKIRRGMAARLILETSKIEHIQRSFKHLILKVIEKVPADDPNQLEVKEHLKWIWHEIDARLANNTTTANVEGLN